MGEWDEGVVLYGGEREKAGDVAWKEGEGCDTE